MRSMLLLAHPSRICPVMEGDIAICEGLMAEQADFDLVGRQFGVHRRLQQVPVPWAEV